MFSLAPARNNSLYPLRIPVRILHSHPDLHLFNNLVTTPQTISRGGLQKGGKRSEQDLGCTMGWEEGESTWVFFISSCVFRLVRARELSRWRIISATCLWHRHLPQRFRKVLRMRKHTCVLMVWPCQIMSTNISLSHKRMAITLAGLHFIFWEQIAWCHSTDSFFVFGSKCWIRVSSPVMIRDLELSPSAL